LHKHANHAYGKIFYIEGRPTVDPGAKTITLTLPKWKYNDSDIAAERYKIFTSGYVVTAGKYDGPLFCTWDIGTGNSTFTILIKAYNSLNRVYDDADFDWDDKEIKLSLLVVAEQPNYERTVCTHNYSNRTYTLGTPFEIECKQRARVLLQDSPVYLLSFR